MSWFTMDRRSGQQKWIDDRLIAAAMRNEMDAVVGLLELGASVNAQNKNGFTALMYASWWEHKAFVDVLLSQGADVHVKNCMDCTALWFAAAVGYDAIVEVLLAAGGGDNDYVEEFEVAVGHGKMSTAGLIVMASCHLNHHRSEYLSHVLRFACEENRVDVVRKIFERPDVDWKRTWKGETLQYDCSIYEYAVRHGSLDVAAYVAERKLEVGSPPDKGKKKSVASEKLPWFDQSRMRAGGSISGWYSALSGLSSDSGVETLSTLHPFVDPSNVRARDMVPASSSASLSLVVDDVDAPPSACAHSVPFIDVGIRWRLWSSSSATIGSDGGVLSSDKCDIQLIVPPFTVSSPQLFSMSIYSVTGEQQVQPATAVDVIKLKPHNKHFNQAVELIAGHANVFTPNSPYSLALYYSADGREWQEAAVLTDIDQKVEYEGMDITAEERHVCIKTRHFSCILFRLFRRSINVMMQMFVPKIESGREWLLKVYLISSDHVKQELEAINQREERKNYVGIAEATHYCYRGQQLEVRVQEPLLPNGWVLQENYRIKPRSYDLLQQELCHRPYYKIISILLRQEGNVAVPMTDIGLHMEVLAGQGDDSCDENRDWVYVQAWRPDQTSESSSVKSEATSVMSSSGELTRREVEKHKESSRKRQRQVQVQLHQTSTVESHTKQEMGEGPAVSAMQSRVMVQEAFGNERAGGGASGQSACSLSEAELECPVTGIQMLEVAEVAGTKWLEIGLYLGFNPSQLKDYEARHHESLYKRLFDLLTNWASRETEATVGMLLAACRRADIGGAAIQALQKHKH